MSDAPTESALSRQRLEEAITAFLEAERTGSGPDRETLLGQHPDLAGELRQFFAEHDRMRQVAGLGAVRYFGDYELLKEIARGGMGIVYKARQVSLNRSVALKMILAGQLASRDDVARFHREAEAAAKLDHPNIVPIYEVGEHNGQQYFSMKLIEGSALAHTGNPKQAGSLLATVARAVHYAHLRGILHRDLKPANILVDHAGQPFVTDFGLAKQLQGDSRLTQSGAIVGTPSYMAPEQAEGRTLLTVAADVYSLGAVLYELLAGRPPFQAKTPLDTLLLVLRTEPVPPSSVQRGVDRDLETICLKCLDKDPDRRYSTAAALADDLDRWRAGEPIVARRSSFWERAVKWARRRPAAAALVAVSTLAVLSLIVGSLVFTHQMHRARLNAEQQRDRALEMERTAGERLWQARFEQARAERLSGRRWRALELLAENARQQATPELRREAIQAATTPGLRLLRSLPIEQPRGMAFSSDGRLLAVQHWQSIRRPDGEFSHLRNQVQVHDLSSGQTLGQGFSTTADHGEPLFAFRPGSTQLVVCEGLSRTSYRVQLRSEQQVRQLAELANQPAMMFSPDGRWLALSAARIVHLFDLDQPAPPRRIGQARVVAFFSAGEAILEDTASRRLKRWNWETGAEVFCSPEKRTLQAISSDGRWACLSMPGQNQPPQTILWDVADEKEVGRLGDVAGDPRSMLIAPDGRYFAADDPDSPNQVLIWERTGSRVLRRVDGVLNPRLNNYTMSQFSPDGRWLVTYAGRTRRVLHFWDVESGIQMTTLREAASPVWSPNGTRLATIGSGLVTDGSGNRGHGADSHIHVWEVAQPTPTYLLREPINALAFTPDGQRVTVNNTLWEVRTRAGGPVLQRTAAPPEGTRLAPAGDGSLWQTRLPNPVHINWIPQPVKLARLAPAPRTITLPSPGRAAHLAVSPSGQHAAVAWELWRRLPGGNGISFHNQLRLELWDLAAEGWPTVLVDPPDVEHTIADGLCFSSDGAWLVVQHHRGIDVYDVKTRTRAFPTRRPTSDRPWTALAVHRGAGLVFTADDEGAVYGLEVASGRQLGRWAGHRGSVSVLATSPDGTVLASGGEDRTIHLWKIGTGRELAQWEAHESGVTALAFSPDGRTLYSGSVDGTLKLWDLPYIRAELTTLGLAW